MPLFAALTILLLLSAPLQAAFTLTDSKESPLRIGAGIHYFEDADRSLSFESILNGQINWQTSDQNIFNKGYSASNWWLKFQLNNPGTLNNYLLEISYPVLDHMELYLVRNNVLSEHFTMGDKFDFESRPIKHRLFLTPLTIKSDDKLDVYIRLNSTSSIQAPIAIWHPETFYKQDIALNVIHGIYIGGMLIIGIYNLLVYLALRDKSYLYYVFYVFSMLLFLASLNGWTFQYLWPRSTQWNDTAIMVFLNGAMLFGIVFARFFLELKQLSHSLNIQAIAWIILGTFASFAYLFIPYDSGIKFAIVFAAMACLWCLASGLYAWQKGQRSAAIYVISWAGILIGGVLLALNKMQVIPKNIFTDQAIQLGSLLEVMLLSFALAQRINHERAKRLRAQQETLDLQSKANEELEASVAARTKELKLANQKLKELSDTDQLTGLKNRRYLDHFLENELVRSLRYQNTLSILILDIDHFKSVNDVYGHLVGDICIKEVAQRFSQQLRIPTDLSARYGGEEFCVLLPETSLEGALAVAERIRKRINNDEIEAPEHDFHKRISVSIGVYSKIPNPDDTPSIYLNNADKALYKAKQNGRNQVVHFETASPAKD
jgi:diguanylate cyclase